MWRAEHSEGSTSVVCIACGTSVSRDDAREYDKQGNRWEREGKQFEHLCKDCHGSLSHQPRAGLESLLTDLEAEASDRGAFLREYVSAVEQRSQSDDA